MSLVLKVSLGLGKSTSIKSIKKRDKNSYKGVMLQKGRTYGLSLPNPNPNDLNSVVAVTFQASERKSITIQMKHQKCEPQRY